VLDGDGNVLARVDARGSTFRTTYSYDALNRLTQTEDPLHHLTTLAYDNNSSLTLRRDANGGRTTYSYDADNRLTQTWDPVGNRTTVVYDDAGRVLANIDGNNHATSYAYDPAGRRTAVQDALGHVTTTLYDPAGNVTVRQDALGNLTTYSYDPDNRLTAVQQPDGGLSGTVFDPAGNISATYDAVGDYTTSCYDALNCCKPSAIRANTSSQSPSLICRNKRIVGYQGVSARSRSQRQSAIWASATQTGTLNAPARWAVAVSAVITRSKPCITAAVSRNAPPSASSLSNS
jgi:YD repeat-containing protein